MSKHNLELLAELRFPERCNTYLRARGSPGQKLSSITIPCANTRYHSYNTGFKKDNQQHDLGNTVNEIWNYGDLNIGGDIGTHPDVEFSYAIARITTAPTKRSTT
jgi:hypothetical protein